MLKKIIFVIAVGVLSACSTTSNLSSHQQESALLKDVKTNQPHLSFSIPNQTLAKIYQDWVGTRYRLGGQSKLGIDCSAFTQVAFQQAFGIHLPRTTTEQRRLGKKINKSALEEGDLVFFRKNRHVGIYVGNNMFMHASTKKGVMLSSLSDKYWQRNYVQSRRIL